MSAGKVVQVIGAVVDVEFPRESIPKIYDALTLTDRDLTLEVEQQLGDGVVRTIAMGASEGLERGLAVTNTGQPISVPVGEKTLGRIMDVLGTPLTKPARSAPRRICPFTVLRRPMKTRRPARNCSRRASR